MITTRIVLAPWRGFREITTRPLYQYDYGQVLKLVGDQLPEGVEFHVGNTNETTVRVYPLPDGLVPIPDEYLETGKDIEVCLYVRDETSGNTIGKIIIPVKKRPSREYQG